MTATQKQAVAQEAIACAMKDQEGGFFFQTFEQKVIKDIQYIIAEYLCDYPDYVAMRFARQYMAPLKRMEDNGLSRISEEVRPDWAVQMRTDLLLDMQQERHRQYLMFLTLLATKEALENPAKAG